MLQWIRLFKVIVVMGCCFIVCGNTVAAPLKTISLDFNSVSLTEALYTIAQFLNTNLILSPDIRGVVSLHLKHVSPLEALQDLLSANDLMVSLLGHSTLVLPRHALLREKEEQLKIEEIDEQVSPLVTKLWRLHYANAEEIAAILQEGQHSLLSKRGRVRVDSRTNTLCVQDTSAHLKAVALIIQRLDVKVEQLMIEARLTNIDVNYESRLGITFDSAPESTDQSPLLRYSLAIAKLADGSLLDVKLAALEEEGHGELISSPRLFTMNQKSASIESGEEIPYQEVSRSGGTGIAFKKAVLSLKVTPHILPDNKVLLELMINQDKASHQIVLGVPAIDTRQMTTNVLVKNGQTIVLGGIYETNQEEGVNRIPFLSKLPLVGKLFEENGKTHTKRELLIFVTPTIVT